MHKDLACYDLLIDLADIGQLSIKMKTTGKVSRKVLKKWQSRDRKNITTSCKHHDRVGDWLPATVFGGRHSLGGFWWQCRRCGNVNDIIWHTEATEIQQRAYPEHIRPHPYVQLGESV